MSQDNNQQLQKAEVFFQRAQKIAATDNFDYAIDMYLEGLRCAPDALRQGHIKLYELALHRKAKGAKKPSMAERIKRLRGKNPLEQLINAEYLFAKDPDHIHYVEAMLKAAVAGEYKETGKWIAYLLFQMNNAVEKPSFQIYILLKDSYMAIGQVERAVIAMQRAVALKPEDGDLAREYQNLSAELAVARGKYDQEGDFRGSIKDREEQEKLQAQQGVVKTQDYRISAVEDARKALAEEPSQPRNIFNLAKALVDMETDEADNEAIELLTDAYEAKSDFSFRQQAGQIRIKQLKRKVREAKIALEANPADENSRAQFAGLAEKLKGIELEHYRLCVENYPTDLGLKYQYAVRLLQNEEYDQAIPLFQNAQRDPRFKVPAMDKTGLCFFLKGWFSDAIDVFTKAIDSYEIKDNDIAKELMYNLGRSYEENGDIEKALDVYHEIAQLDFGYKDVGKRIEELRSK